MIHVIMADGRFTSTDEVTYSICRTPVPWSPMSPVLFLCSCLYKTVHYSQGRINKWRCFIYKNIYTFKSINDRCQKREADCCSSFSSVRSGPMWGVLFSPPAALLKPLLSKLTNRNKESVIVLCFWGPGINYYRSQAIISWVDLNTGSP